MIIKKLELINFRNYECVTIEFGAGLNILYGNNAQGKTNLLEAMYVCATSKSHRTNRLKDMIRLDCEQAHIQAVVFDESETIIDTHLLQNGKKKMAINKLPIRKLDELLGHIHIIMFSPEDLSLIKEGPKARRKFIDIELSQLNPVYYHYLHEYHFILKQRNALLKQVQQKKIKDAIQIGVWNEQLVKTGNKVIEYRSEFIRQLNPIYQNRHFQISGQKEKMELVYDKNIPPEYFYDKLIQAQEKDIRFGSTSVGPHRDDLRFEINQQDLKVIGSQGQQRTAAISLKLSEIELVLNQTQNQPILLLDDVLSELDQERSTYLMDHLQGIQTFVTCTGTEEFRKLKTKAVNYYEVKKGSIQKPRGESMNDSPLGKR